MTASHLSDDARSFINQLDSEHARGEARGWAAMDPQLFQVKVGMAIEKLDKKVDEMLLRSRRQPILPAVFTEMTGMQKGSIVVTVGGIIVYVIANWPSG